MPKNKIVKQTHEELLSQSVKDLNRIVIEIGTKLGKESALAGLEGTAYVFHVLLNIYANPNTENPQGMVDDPESFRKHFADIILTGKVPRLEI